MPDDINQIAAGLPEAPLRTIQIPIYFRFSVREEDQIKAESALETAIAKLSKQIGQQIRQETERYGGIEYGGWTTS